MYILEYSFKKNNIYISICLLAQIDKYFGGLTMGRNFRFKEQTIVETTKICKALSEPIRLRLLGLLGIHHRGREACIGDLAERLEKDQSVIYRHIKILEAVGLVKTKKEGNCLYSRTTSKAARIITFFREKEYQNKGRVKKQKVKS